MTPELTTSATLAEQLLSRIELRTARVCVVGLGYVGLPLAETFAWGGFPVLGFDIPLTALNRSPGGAFDRSGDRDAGENRVAFSQGIG